ncbi:MAG: ComEA family DNA-binding protein [Candidatus Marinimicrobia bacterium]|nr:ComEA family DNA-binding protein [Candidatus Neomarinimicrobiota bacterium]
MLNLTRQEKSVVRFLLIFFLVGGIIHIYNVKVASKHAISNIETIQDSLKSKVAYNDSMYFSTSKNSDKKGIDEEPLSLNTATRAQLMQIKGIGPVTADRIIKYREIHGEFHSTQELTNIKGIGIKTVEKIKNEVTIE